MKIKRHYKISLITENLSKYWILFIGVALILGTLLRVIFVSDMEYKEDEEYNFTQSQAIGTTSSWPWYGIPSGVYLVNPGMSIWVFAFLAKIFGIHQPTALANAVQLFALLGMSLIIPFVLKFVEKENQREWLWALTLAMVNPFLILYQRKLWPEPFLPFFTLITFMGWWRKHTHLGAWTWGFIGALLGQIHMSGFFFAFALFFWTLLFGPIGAQSNDSNKKIAWNYWFFGSIIGALPLIPWIVYIIQHPTGHSMSNGWAEALQLKYWVFWFTDATGLHLGNPLGLLRGPSHWDQISDFVRYPIIQGKATYLNGLAHLICLICTIIIFLNGLKSFWTDRKSLSKLVIGKSSNTAFVQNSSLIGCGVLLTLTGVMIRRYYLAVTFPLEFICLVRMANPNSKLGSHLLAMLWICELIISSNFVGYIHANEGSTQGDYGSAYHLIIQKKN